MTLTPQLIEDYLRRLAEDERGAATIDKYRRDLLRFYEFLPPDKAVDKAVVLSWKEQLVARKDQRRELGPQSGVLLPQSFQPVHGGKRLLLVLFHGGGLALLSPAPGRFFYDTILFTPLSKNKNGFCAAKVPISVRVALMRSSGMW